MEKEAQWTESMQAELDKLSTSPKYGPAFYYLSGGGRNTFFWPWPQRYYWWRTKWLNLSNYVEFHAPMKEFVSEECNY